MEPTKIPLGRLDYKGNLTLSDLPLEASNPLGKGYEEIIIPPSCKYIALFLTMKCNLDCASCLNSMPKHDRNKFEELPSEEWVKVLDRIKSRPDVPITFSGGEPTVYKDFITLVNNLKPSLRNKL